MHHSAHHKPPPLTPFRRSPLTAQCGCLAVFLTYWYTRRPPASMKDQGDGKRPAMHCSHLLALNDGACQGKNSDLCHFWQAWQRAAAGKGAPGVFTIRVRLDRLW